MVIKKTGQIGPERSPDRAGGLGGGWSHGKRGIWLLHRARQLLRILRRGWGFSCAIDGGGAVGRGMEAIAAGGDGHSAGGNAAPGVDREVWGAEEDEDRDEGIMYRKETELVELYCLADLIAERIARELLLIIDIPSISLLSSFR